ncbi:hydantoinase B/oxoprolinase family protein [Flavimaribacter sediminis]|nr:hydantoinase B/oxoprolinase family protein [Flavimaribacter sediminis]
MRSQIDPITLAIIQNRLDFIARQMGWVMIRTSRSPIFNQSHDFSCFIADAEGHLISQADGIPIHTGGGGFAVEAILDYFGDDIHKGDVFLLNDPYVAGGNHLPDWVVAWPVFEGDTLIAFTCNRAHQSDIGGGAAGTYNPEATEIFHEGIRIPPVKLVRDGEMDDDLFRLLMLNTRTPHLLEGDLLAMIGSARIGAEELLKLSASQEGGLRSAFEGVMDHAERKMKHLLQNLDDGEYSYEESFDNDCFETRKIRICVTLKKSKDRLTVDFAGTDPQIKGFKNSSLANTYSAVYAGIVSFFGKELPRNSGTFRAIEISAPKGSLVNPNPPAPVTMCTVFPAHEIMHCIWFALTEASPERALAGWGKNSFPVTSGRDRENRTWVMYNWSACSGAGATRTRDGFEQIGPIVTLGGLTIPNAETFEQIYPVRIHKQELRCDGGGSGEHRGGSGVDYDVEFLTDVEMSFRSEGADRPTGVGVCGGGDGKMATMDLRNANGEAVAVPDYGNVTLGPNRMRISSPGGGGVGNPAMRDAELVLRDVRDGLVSIEAAREDYRVVVNSASEQIDWPSTRSLRNNADSR